MSAHFGLGPEITRHRCLWESGPTCNGQTPTSSESAVSPLHYTGSQTVLSGVFTFTFGAHSFSLHIMVTLTFEPMEQGLQASRCSERALCVCDKWFIA